MDFNLRVPQIDEIKMHFRKHENHYILGGAVVTTATVTFLVTRRLGVQTVIVAPVFSNTPTYRLS